MLTLIQSLLPEGSQKGSSLSCDESFLSKSQVRRRNKVLLCAPFIFLSRMKWRSVSHLPPKLTQTDVHPWSSPTAPQGLGYEVKHLSSLPLSSAPPFDVQVTGGVNCAGFDVELGDFIVTSMPTRRAASHFSHLNNHVPSFTSIKSLNTCFPHCCWLPCYLWWGRAVLKYNRGTHVFCKHPKASSDGW